MTRGRVFAVVSLVLVVIALIAGAVWLSLVGGGRAQREGVAAIPGLSGPVEVAFDAAGVPYVEAASVEDLAAAQGWLHANDRMTQIEFGRRVVAGRVAEVAGPVALELDRNSRTLRFRRTAERLWETAGPESRRWLEAYARGVNARLAEYRESPPPGLWLTGADPEPWTPADSLGFVLLMADDLSFWDGRPEEERFRWLRAFGVEATRDLLGGDPHVPDEIVALAEAGAAPGALPRAELGGPPVPEARSASPGSNNWALAGGRTASGAPLVANDPHLGLALPPTWYQVHLRAPGYAAAGMSIPGVPGVVIGHSAELAWALTNVMLDDHDLFFERIEERPDGSLRVRRGDGWAPVRSRRETIRVAGGDDVVLELHATDRGPLLPADEELGLPPRSLAWTLYGDRVGGTLRPGDPVSAFLALARATSVGEAVRGLAGYDGPAQNVVIADRDGGIVWTVLGRVPERTSGDGRLPSPGGSLDYGWRGLRARDANPAIADPPDGTLVTANARVVPPGFPFPMTANYDTPHRAARIRALLAGRPRWDVDATVEIQTDVVSLYALELVAAALAPAGAPVQYATGGAPAGPAAWPTTFPGAAGRAAAMLAGWDGRVAARTAAGEPNPAAALAAIFERRLAEEVFGDEAAAHGLGPLTSRGRLLRAVRGEMAAAWFDDVRTPRPETRGEIVGRALAGAWEEAVGRWGSDPAGWDYDELHTLTLGHPLGGAPVVGRRFERGPVAVPGSASTVAAFGAKWRGGGMDVTYGPSMRMVTDLADLDRTVAVLPGGQAGHPWDPRYDDQLPDYLAGRVRPFPWTPEAIEAAAVSRLRLAPPAAAGAGG